MTTYAMQQQKSATHLPTFRHVYYVAYSISVTHVCLNHSM